MGLYGVLSLGSMASMSIGAGILALSVGGDLLFQPQGRRDSPEERLWIRRYLFASGVLSSACLVSLVINTLDPYRITAVGVPPRATEQLAKLGYLFWPGIIWCALRRLKEDMARQILLAWLGMMTVLGALGIVQFFTGFPRTREIPEILWFHATLFMGHHLSVASILIFPFFVAVESAWGRNLIVRRCFASPKAKLLATLGSILGGSTLVLTYSRTLWVALPLGLVIWRLLERRISLSEVVQARPTVRSLKIKLLIFGSVAAILIFLGPHLLGRWNLHRGTMDRLNLWRANLRFFADRPLFGVGFRANEELTGQYLRALGPTFGTFQGHAHNNILELLATLGVSGFIAWVGWNVVIFWGWIVHRHIPYRNACLAAWCVLHVNGLTQVNIWEGKVQHQMAWVIAGFWLSLRLGENNDKPRLVAGTI